MVKSEKEKMLAGEPYNPLDSELAAISGATKSLLLKFNTSNDQTLLESLFKQKLDGVKVVAPFFCDYGQNIKFGKNVFVNFNCTFLDCAEIEIGDNCMIASDVKLYTATHPINPEERNSGLESAKPIKIRANCWIGGGAIILPGVEIGEGTTIGAGSVVTKNIPSRVVAVGNPCKVVKEVC